MDYSKYTPHQTKKISIDWRFVEIDGDIWQINNLTRVSLGTTPVELEFPEPEFHGTQPKRKLNLAKAFFIFSLGIVASIMFLIQWVYIISLVAALVIIIQSLTSSKKQIDLWSNRRDQYLERLEKWVEISKKGPVLYSLTLEPSSSSSPLFYSYDQSKIQIIVDTIRKAMAKELNQEKLEFKVNAADLQGKTEIEELGQTIVEAIEKEITSISDTQYMQSGLLQYLRQRFLRWSP